MKNNKSPGSDEFTSEFLKFFWKDLKVFVIGSLNYGYSLGSLSVTQKQGIITCFPYVPTCNKTSLIIIN
jgi:hypothetical protein